MYEQGLTVYKPGESVYETFAAMLLKLWVNQTFTAARVRSDNNSKIAR